MSLLRSLALVVISVLLIISFSVVTIGTSVNELLYPGVYEKIFEKNSLYDVAQEKLLQQTGLPSGAITKEEIKANIDHILSNVLSYVRSETSELDLKINISQDSIRSYIALEASKLPVCQTGMVPPNCRPPNMAPAQLVDYMLSQSGISIADISSIDLSQLVPQIKDQLDSARQIIRLFHSLMLSILLLSVIFIALLVLLARKIGVAKWLGVSLLFSGIIVMMIGYLLPSVIGNIASISENQLSVIFKDVVSAVSGTILMYGAILFIVGLLLIFYHFFRKKPKKKR